MSASPNRHGGKTGSPKVVGQMEARFVDSRLGVGVARHSTPNICSTAEGKGQENSDDGKEGKADQEFC